MHLINQLKILIYTLLQSHRTTVSISSITHKSTSVINIWINISQQKAFRSDLNLNETKRVELNREPCKRKFKLKQFFFLSQETDFTKRESAQCLSQPLPNTKKQRRRRLVFQFLTFEPPIHFLQCEYADTFTCFLSSQKFLMSFLA